MATDTSPPGRLDPLRLRSRPGNPFWSLTIRRTSSWRTSNGDGKVDLVYVTASLRANGIQAGKGVYAPEYYPALTPLYEEAPGQAFDFADTRNWLPMDAKNNDGRSGPGVCVSRRSLSGATSPVMSILALNAAHDRMTNASNGLMATTAITYKTSAGLHTNLPPGSLWNIVDKITRTDTVKSLSYTTAYTYGGARWSYQEKQSLGFASAEAREAKSKTVTFYDQTVEACGSRPYTSIDETLTGNVLSQVEYRYVSAGSQPPFLCLSESVVTSECDGRQLRPPTALPAAARGCHQRLRQCHHVYDRGLNSDPGDDRRQVAVYDPKFKDYLIGLPASLRPLSSYNTSTLAWDQVAQSSQHLRPADHTHRVQPPGSLRGEIRKTLVWNNMQEPSEPTGKIATAFDYDAVGNVIKVTGPTGMTTTAVYQCAYKRFAFSICNGLGQVRDSDPRAGAPTHVISLTGYNAGDTTRFTTDALGRPSSLLRPDGSFVVHAYLNYGTPLQAIATVVSDGGDPAFSAGSTGSPTFSMALAAAI